MTRKRYIKKFRYLCWRLSQLPLMISWDFLVHLIRMMELISNGQSLDSSN